jgi:hypothetical protein
VVVMGSPSNEMTTRRLVPSRSGRAAALVTPRGSGGVARRRRRRMRPAGRAHCAAGFGQLDIEGRRIDGPGDVIGRELRHDGGLGSVGFTETSPPPWVLVVNPFCWSHASQAHVLRAAESRDRIMTSGRCRGTRHRDVGHAGRTDLPGQPRQRRGERGRRPREVMLTRLGHHRAFNTVAAGQLT